MHDKGCVDREDVVSIYSCASCKRQRETKTAAVSLQLREESHPVLFNVINIQFKYYLSASMQWLLWQLFRRHPVILISNALALSLPLTSYGKEVSEYAVNVFLLLMVETFFTFDSTGADIRIYKLNLSTVRVF